MQPSCGTEGPGFQSGHTASTTARGPSSTCNPPTRWNGGERGRQHHGTRRSKGGNDTADHGRNLRTETHNTSDAPKPTTTTTNSLISSFADDLAMVLGTRRDAEIAARDLHGYLQDFLIDVHVATPSCPISKSVALFIPAKGGRASTGATTAMCEAPLKVGRGGGSTINFVKEAKYLGHVICTQLTDDAHIQSRMGKAAQVFGAMRKPLFGNKDVWRMVKAKIMTTMIIPTMLDGAECCTVTARRMREMESLYLRMVRNCLGVTTYTTRKYNVTSEKLLERLGVKPLHYYLDLKVLAYAGHVERMGTHRLPKITRDSRLHGPRTRGRPCKSRKVNVSEALKRKSIDENTWRQKAGSKKSWAKTIRLDLQKSARATPTKRATRPRWYYNPIQLCIIGCRVERKFQTKWHVGKITALDQGDDTNETIWRVQYDDGDEEDFNAAELQKYLS